MVVALSTTAQVLMDANAAASGVLDRGRESADGIASAVRSDDDVCEALPLDMAITDSVRKVHERLASHLQGIEQELRYLVERLMALSEELRVGAAQVQQEVHVREDNRLQLFSMMRAHVQEFLGATAGAAGPRTVLPAAALGYDAAPAPAGEVSPASAAACGPPDADDDDDDDDDGGNEPENGAHMTGAHMAGPPHPDDDDDDDDDDTDEEPNRLQLHLPRDGAHTPKGFASSGAAGLPHPARAFAGGSPPVGRLRKAEKEAFAGAGALTLKRKRGPPSAKAPAPRRLSLGREQPQPRAH